MIKKIDSADELRAMPGSQANFLVYFYNDGCAPCLSLRPKVEQLMFDRFPKMDLIYINSLDYPELVAEYQAFSFPVIIIYFEGKEFRRYSKYVSITELGEVIGRIYALYYLEDQSS